MEETFLTYYELKIFKRRNAAIPFFLRESLYEDEQYIILVNGRTYNRKTF